MNKKKFILKAKQLIKEIKKSNKGFDNLLKELGFEIYCPLYCSNCDTIYKHKKEKIVVKPEPYTCGYKPRKRSVPTIYFNKNGDKWCIQPLCSIKRASKAYKIIDSEVPSWQDAAPCNCGWWGNKAVIFDW
jgi:hypothetical protein